MKNITKNKRFNPTEITGELEIMGTYDRVCKTILTFEDFKEIEKGTFEFINDGKLNEWQLSMLFKRRSHKEDYLKIVIKVEPLDRCSSLLKVLFNRKKETKFPFVFLSIMSVAIVATGIESLYTRTQGDYSVPLPAIIFALSFPLLCFLCALIWFPVIGQVDMFQRSFIAQLKERMIKVYEEEEDTAL